jgi:hypothetical protein
VGNVLGGADIVPLVGAWTRVRPAEALPASAVSPGADEPAAIETAVPKGAARGDRYPAAMTANLGVEN